MQEAAALGHGGLRQLMSFEYRWKVRKHFGWEHFGLAPSAVHPGSIAACSSGHSVTRLMVLSAPAPRDVVLNREHAPSAMSFSRSRSCVRTTEASTLTMQGSG